MGHKPNKSLHVKCEICGYICSYKYKLKLHLLIHLNKKSFMCNICQARFNRETGLRKHLLTHSNKRPHKCNRCTLAFKRKAHLRRHLLTHNSEDNFKCKICFKFYETLVNLQFHQKNTHNRPYKCEECNAAFSNKFNLKAHLLGHSSARPFKCDKCPWAAKTMSYLKKHLARHTNERPFKCLQCDGRFKCKKDLSSHQLIHNTERPFKCNECQASFKFKSYLKTHLRTHSVLNAHMAAQFHCDKYECKFYLKTKFNKHLLSIHTKRNSECKKCLEPKYICFDCNFSCRDRKYFIRHWSKNHGQDIIASMAAIENRRDKAEDRSHLATRHSDARPLSCDKCSLTFKTKKCLQSHLWSVHADIRFIRFKSKLKPTGRLYKCDECGATFSVLKNHMVRHMGKQFHCDKCKCMFSRKRELSNHLVRIHAKEKSECKMCLEPKYICFDCNFSTRSRQYFINHWSKSHGQNFIASMPAINTRDKRVQKFAETAIYRNIPIAISTEQEQVVTEVPFECGIIDKSFANQRPDLSSFQPAAQDTKLRMQAYVLIENNALRLAKNASSSQTFGRVLPINNIQNDNLTLISETYILNDLSTIFTTGESISPDRSLVENNTFYFDRNDLTDQALKQELEE